MSKLYISSTSDAIKTLRTCRGHKNATTHIRGWDCGIRVDANETDTGIEFLVYLTNGSNDPSNRICLKRVNYSNKGHVFLS